MRIELTKDNLLAQLPDGDLPEVIYLEGKEVDVGIDTEAEKYPNEYVAFTEIEWNMWKRLCQGPAHYKELAVYSNPRALNHSNLVAVHIMAMRRKLSKSEYRIHSQAGQGKYMMVPKFLETQEGKMYGRKKAKTGLQATQGIKTTNTPHTA